MKIIICFKTIRVREKADFDVNQIQRDHNLGQIRQNAKEWGLGNGSERKREILKFE